ncbi:Hypothetical predicted protein, partial [Marmota monax]
MKNPSIVGVLCTDSQGLNLGCKCFIQSLYKVSVEPVTLPCSSFYFPLPWQFLRIFVEVEILSK